MASVSVYGYDQRMLAAPCNPRPEDNKKNSPRPNLSQGSTNCPLLKLPLEIRINIYKHILPTTAHLKTKGTAWLRDNIALLATNKQIYAEAIKIMYGSSTFVIDVSYDSITFAYQWLLPSGLVPKTTLTFPQKFAE